MKIHLQRTLTKGEICEGLLRIDGTTICNTLENAQSALPAGTYQVYLHKCHQYRRKMLLLSPLTPGLDSPTPHCAKCKPCPEVTLNTILPTRCPMLKPGNGIHGRHDGSILVGNTPCPGLITQPRATFSALYDRLRMTYQRGGQVTLEIHS